MTTTRKGCQYVTDHFGAKRCNAEASHRTKDRDGWDRPVCATHALVLREKGYPVRYVRKAAQP